MMMKAAIGLAVLACAAVAAAMPTMQLHRSAETDAAFESWRQSLNRTYPTAEAHSRARLTFAANLATIAALNEGEEFKPFGLNKFADLSPEEFRARYLLPKGVLEKAFAARRAVTPEADVASLPQALPKSFDWRDQGSFVTPVKDQGQCGSCWAFSTTENIESVAAIQGKKQLRQFSVQQIVSCDTKDDGCNGGDLPTAYEYVIKAGGLELESTYPYTSGNGNTGVCKDKSGKEVQNIDGWEYATRSKNETAMQVYLQAKAPLAICVDAETWQFYNGGIVKRHCGKALDHCVQATGWGEQNGTPYWSVRNSWNSDWGENGYIRIERNDDLCGISKEPASAIIKA